MQICHSQVQVRDLHTAILFVLFFLVVMLLCIVHLEAMTKATISWAIEHFSFDDTYLAYSIRIAMQVYPDTTSPQLLIPDFVLNPSKYFIRLPSE